ncbi:NADPH-dependent FMN reductase [Comamonas composti]|uniref:NADPH-dependent FMN reductase n=1 Tax=Comamonas composti TaxID=408558 RepID=UPI000411F23B|nr:NADPH-dependent FMN reductase [Comamonas composti]
MSIVLIAGSPSQPSRSTALLQATAHKLRSRELAVQAPLVLSELPAQALLKAQAHESGIDAAVARVAQAQVLVVATPVYKAAYSGLLKVFLDLLAQTAFRDKLILPLATGGSPHHMLALDYALRPVLQSLGARHILPGIYATEHQVRLLPEGGHELAPEISARIDEAVQLIVDDRRRQARPATEFEPVDFAQVRCSV